jgi:hypothetical protein
VQGKLSVGAFHDVVVPANAWTHNHRLALLRMAVARACSKHLPVVMGPASALAIASLSGTTSRAWHEGAGSREFAFSRHEMPKFFNRSTLIKKRAQGRPGGRMHPGPPRKKLREERVDHRYRRIHSSLPCAMVLRLIRALPGDQALLSPLLCVIPQSVAPALGRQDHTTSPSASCHSSDDAPRPSHPAPNVRDDREASLLSSARPQEKATDLGGRSTRRLAADWHDGQSHFAYASDIASARIAGWAKAHAPCPPSLRESFREW